MTFVRFAARVVVNVAALSGLGEVGNYNQVAVAKVLHDGSAYEVPVMTGNALKHWHAVYAAEEYVRMGGKYANDLCKLGIGVRGYKHDSTLDNLQLASNECEAIMDFCNDLHGFLIAAEGRSTKRDSLVKASFMVPVLEAKNLEAVSKFAVQHNRVAPEQVRRAIKEGEAMMLFKQEYASGLYGFYVRLDLDKVLTPMFETCSNKSEGAGKIKKDDEIKLRRRATVAALLKLLTGAGSKQARALPVVDVKEVLAAVSTRPIPNLIHPAYPDYCKKSMDVLNAYKAFDGGNIKVLYYGGEPCAGVEAKNTLKELFDELVKEVDGGGSS